MMRLLVRLFFAVVFFVAGAALTIALVWIVHTLEGRNTTPSFLWLTGPILTALGGWRYGGQMDIEGIVGRMGRRQRMVFGFSALWVVACVVVFSVFDPFGRYRWDISEWVKFGIITVGPILMTYVAGRISRWASASSHP